jgi:hypothetical protein
MLRALQCRRMHELCTSSADACTISSVHDAMDGYYYYSILLFTRVSVRDKLACLEPAFLFGRPVEIGKSAVRTEEDGLPARSRLHNFTLRSMTEDSSRFYGHSASVSHMHRGHSADELEVSIHDGEVSMTVS